jgi:AcrR family transcriptional regulator
MTTRQKDIITAAGKILSQEGTSGLTIKNIASEMKFSESAIYRHFKSKEDIILEMLNFLADDMQTRCERVIAQQTSATQQVKHLFTHQISYFQNNPHFVSAVFSDGLLEESERVNTAIKKVMQVKFNLLMPVIDKGQKAQEFTNLVSCENLVEILMGSFRLQMYKWKASGFKSDINNQGNQIIQDIINLIQQP